ncbi:MAG: sigma-70 family RNA polymerase sigma factor, partial [Acetatifactor sp.]|nr:sigma-70 family RNA polymerase sigma factor [Acetatifactor sp.]
LGVKFSTYAVPMITGEIKRFLRDDGPVKVSRTLKERAMKVRMARAKLQGEMGREPGLEEIARETGIEPEDIIMAMESESRVESIYSSVYQDDGSEIYLVDKVAAGSGGCGSVSTGSQDPEKDQLLNHLLLQQLLSTLKEQERQLIVLRYYRNHTQTEVASILGISQVQVSRLEKKILLHMRQLAVE